MLRPSLCLTALIVLAACDDTPDAPPRPNPDEALECLPEGSDAGPISDGGVALGCGAGEVCVQGRCYGVCVDDSDCGPRETCGADGVCTRGASMDAGTADGGPPPGPCTGVECAAPLVCHPLAGECVECSEGTVGAGPGEPGFCPGLRPICDVANGRCVEAAPAQCAPCNDDTECVLPGGFSGRCVTRTVMDVREQVCLQPCAIPDGGVSDGGVPLCPAGLTCDTDEEVCVPPAGATCTTWRAAVDRRSCLGDEDCNPLAASAAFFTGACEGVMAPTPPDGGMADGAVPADAGPATPGTCLQPCGETADCFDTGSGQECSGSDAMLFCAIPPASPPP